MSHDTSLIGNHCIISCTAHVLMFMKFCCAGCVLDLVIFLLDSPIKLMKRTWQSDRFHSVAVACSWIHFPLTCSGNCWHASHIKNAALGGFHELKQKIIWSLLNVGNFTPENREILLVCDSFFLSFFVALIICSLAVVLITHG